MTTQELINQYVTAHADNRWMDASELEALLTEFAEKLKEPASEKLEDALKAKVDKELQDPVFGKLINTFAAYAFAKQIVNWHKEQMMKDAVELGVWNYSNDTDMRALPIWGKEEFSHLKEDDKVKVIIIKE